MMSPDANMLFEALDATWPAAKTVSREPWCIREGRGGGQRVSAATAQSDVISPDDIGMAEIEMRALNQRPIFMLRDREDWLDSELERRSYEIIDPVTLYLCPTEKLTAPIEITDAMPSWPPLAIQSELWSAGGIGPARVAVMERVKGHRISLLGRTGDTPAGTVFVGLHGGVAMLHALEVSENCRRKGVGQRLMHGAANWANSVGARWLTLAVTRANTPANALYRALGMVEAATYHYRRAPEATS